MPALSERSRTLAAMALIALVAVVVHWPGLSSQAISLDDAQFLTRNWLVRNPSLESLRVFFGEVLEPTTVGGYYTPLTMTSLMLDCAFGGTAEHLEPFHRTHLLLHAVNGALLVLLLARLVRSPLAAGIVGALFVAHPLTVEPVTWLSERKTLLATAFALGALVVYVRAVERGRRSRWGVLLFALSLLSKPTTVALPLLLVLLDVWPLRRFERRTVLEKWPWFLVAAVSSVVTLVSHSASAGLRVEGAQALLGALRAPAFYLLKLLRPSGLTSHYDVPEPLTLGEPLVAAGLALAAAGAIAMAVSWRRRREWFVALPFFLLGLAPTLGFVRYSWVVVSDKYVYFPVVGLLLPLAAVLARWLAPTTVSRATRAVILVAASVLVVLEAVGTRAYLEVWSDTPTLYAHMAREAPDSARAADLYGNVLAADGREEAALAEYRRALELDPGFSIARVDLGCLLYQRGAADEAVRQWERALEADPDDANALSNLALALDALGRNEEARAAFERALELQPRNVDTHNNYGLLLFELGERERARAEFEEALRRMPDHPNANVNLGVALEREGKLQAALASLLAGLDHGADPAPTLAHVARVRLRLGDHAGAARAFDRLVELDPGNEVTWNNSAAVRVRLGDLETARRHARTAVDLNPDYLDARVNLAIVLERLGRLDEALVHCTRALELDPGNRAAAACRDAVLAAKAR